MSIQTERERASQDIAELYQNSFFQRYWQSISRFIGSKKPAPLWASAAIVMIANLLLGVIVSALLGETQFTTLSVILETAMLVTWTYFGILLTFNIYGRMMEFLQLRFTISLQHEQHIHALLLWANRWLGHQIPQLLFSFSIGIGLALLSFYGIYPATKFSFGQTLIFFVNFFHITVALYGLFSLIDFVLRFKSWDLILFSDNPASSPILLQLAKELRNFIFSAAIAIATLLLLMGLIHKLTITITLASLVFAWIPILALFILGNQALSQQIIRVKHKRIEQLQSEIMKLSSNVEKMDTDTIAHVKSLIDYHDRVNSSRNSLYNAQSFINLFGSLALPILSAILSTIDVWQKIFGKP